jgi:4-diphosphocytidyl-2-C-methyl-D-erythritol kinase
LASALIKRRNDLAPPAMMLEPAVKAMLDAIGQTQGCLLARMSGSGATCFGLYADEESADQAADALAAAHPDWWVSPAPILS